MLYGVDSRYSSMYLFKQAEKISKWPGQGPRLCCGAGLARGRHFKHKGKRSGFLSVLMHYGVLWEVVHSYIGS